MSVVRVGAVLSEWGRQLQAHAIDHAVAIEVVLVRDRRAALGSQVTVLCLDSQTRWVDRSLLADAAAAGVTVVGVFTDIVDEQRWVEWGVTDRMSAALTADSMTFLLARLAPAGGEEAAGPAPTASSADRSGSWPWLVGGPPGAGAREVAIGVAGVLARTGSVVLIDANECGGGVARRLGYAETPNVLTAAALAASAADLFEAVAAPVVGAAVGFDVISGLPAAAAWTELPPAAAAAVIAGCRSRWDEVVVATSPMVEDLRRWGDRYGTSRTLLATAPRVIGVCEASPRGVVRFGEWLIDAHPDGAVSVIVNKVPPRSAFVAGEVRERLVSLCGADRVDVIGVLPFDRRVVRAEWNATPVPSGPFTRALAAATEQLTVRSPVGVTV